MKFMRIKNYFIRLDQIKSFKYVSNNVYIDFINDTNGLVIVCKDVDAAAKTCLDIETRINLM